MNYLTLNIANSKVVVTKHARDRAIQRARLYLAKIPPENINWWLTKDFRQSKIDTKYINCPFYVNYRQWDKGRGSFKSFGKFSSSHSGFFLPIVILPTHQCFNLLDIKVRFTPFRCV